MKSFVIGRYYFNTLFREQANKNFINDLTKEPLIEEDSFVYALGNFSGEEPRKGFNLLRGTFGRIRKGDMGEVYDKKNKEFKKELMPDIADVILEFIIDHENHLIFFEHNSSINPSYFASKFKKIYQRTSPVSDFEIDFIFIEKDVYETIKKWEIVEKVVFRKLRPSNPDSLDYFKDIEDLLKETGSENTNIDFNAPLINGKSKKSLNYESKLIKQSLALSSHGYGEAKLQGIEKGKKVDVESNKFMKKVEIDFGEDGALEKIIQTVEEIKSTK